MEVICQNQQRNITSESAILNNRTQQHQQKKNVFLGIKIQPIPLIFKNVFEKILLDDLPDK